MKGITAVAVCWLTMTAAAPVPARAQLSSACQAVSNAMLRVTTTPHHTVATSSKTSEVTESIMVSDTNDYSRVYHSVHALHRDAHQNHGAWAPARG
jgi:hypothetical protein